MPPAEARIVAPISVWIAAAVLAALTWAAAWFAVTGAGLQLDTRFTQYNRDRIHVFAAQANASGARRIVILGSSALKYATRDEREFAAGVSAAAGVPVAALRVSSNWGTFYDFAPIAEDLLRTKPDLVVMESELLATDRPPVRRFVLWVRQLRTNLGLDVADVVPTDSEFDEQFNYPCWHRKASMRHDLLRQVRDDWVAVDPDGPGPDAARVFAERLLATGANVAFVAVPRRPDYEAEARATRELLARDPGFQLLSARVKSWTPGSPPIEEYCDLTHVKPAGRDRLSNWLESAAARALPEPRTS